ncbi:isochorismatase domain-containing protein 1-like isoform X2 [Bolinopsis microptera]|uniref:isochorismatase domain-containing protein 1-like isoform X2 n=1 Tax=Bolinopsis microptera TaxID=2820187 RepID=UPI00307A8358
MSVGRLIASRTAMFCCDMQDKFRPSIRHFPAILSNANRMLQSAKLLDIPLVVTEQYPKGLGSTCSELDIDHCSINCPKTKFSMMIPEVKSYLEEKKTRKSIVLFGIEAHVCIQQTAIDLISLGYEVHVIVDATSSRTDTDRVFAFQRMRQAGVFLTTSESMILTLAGGSDHPQFKQLQKIITTEAEDTKLLTFPML